MMFSCCDVHGNAGGDWVGCIADQDGINGNFSADPLCCNDEGGDFTLRSDSPCLPGRHPDGEDCGLGGELYARIQGRVNREAAAVKRCDMLDAVQNEIGELKSSWGTTY